MYARARLEKSLIRSVTNTFSFDRHSLTTVLKLSFPRFCFKDTAVTVFGTPPGILDSLPCKLTVAFGCPINKNTHLPSRWLKKCFLLLKIKAAGHQRLKGKAFVKNAVSILPSIDYVLWKSCFIDNPAFPKNLWRPFGFPSHPSTTICVVSQIGKPCSCAMACIAASCLWHWLLVPSSVL